MPRRTSWADRADGTARRSSGRGSRRATPRPRRSAARSRMAVVTPLVGLLAGHGPGRRPSSSTSEAGLAHPAEEVEVLEPEEQVGVGQHPGVDAPAATRGSPPSTPRRPARGHAVRGGTTLTVWAPRPTKTPAVGHDGPDRRVARHRAAVHPGRPGRPAAGPAGRTARRRPRTGRPTGSRGSANASTSPARNPPAGPRLAGSRTMRTASSRSGSSRPPSPLTTTTTRSRVETLHAPAGDRTTSPARRGRGR